eukprot:maker-scaffold9435_size2419-snap-gene-0.0 protein:Tk01439 transcript:maker-scaffold9435_size2419-snap-gene-0.0-mRNA-1 annotation:"pyruvate carboxylase"
MLKAASGGGGRGMRVIRNQEQLEKAFFESKREALNAFGDDTVFLEKYVENPKHIEIQIVADNFGTTVHLYERDCSVQRRYQKVIEFAPSFGLKQETKDALYAYAIAICKAVDYNNIGTVEFLVDDDDSIYFIEVNPRIQVEHTVTEVVTNIDLVKTQLFIAGGYKLTDKQIKIKNQESITVSGFALQCRITTEDPANDFKPDYGTITTYRSASGFGIRLDADTTMRDAHQSLLATRMRSFDMLKVAEGYAKNHPEIFSMEVWGGATFDVCMRFLQEDPWERLQKLRKAMPNVLLQMLLRGSNGVGYKAYPDNLIELFVEKSWENGVDVFRIFDSLNWMESIAPCIGHVRNKTNGLAEGSICYTNDILNPDNKKYNLKYYTTLAKQIEDAGAHILGIKDMAGLLKPYAAQELI